MMTLRAAALEGSWVWGSSCQSGKGRRPSKTGLPRHPKTTYCPRGQGCDLDIAPSLPVRQTDDIVMLFCLRPPSGQVSPNNNPPGCQLSTIPIFLHFSWPDIDEASNSLTMLLGFS